MFSTSVYLEKYEKNVFKTPCTVHTRAPGSLMQFYNNELHNFYSAEY